MNKPNAVLFDFDGVVVDSFNVHYAAWSKAFEEIFKKETPTFPTTTHAGKAPILIAEYFAEVGGDKSQAKLLNNLKAEYLHSSTIAPNLLPGVKELTALLKDQNIPYGIASNATKQFIQNSINQLEIDFDIFTGVEDYKFPKPHPEAYLTLAKKLGVNLNDIQNTWVLEDSVTGITAAKDGGMIPVGILTHRPKEALQQAGSKIEFGDLLGVFEYLKEF